MIGVVKFPHFPIYIARAKLGRSEHLRAYSTGNRGEDNSKTYQDQWAEAVFIERVSLKKHVDGVDGDVDCFVQLKLAVVTFYCKGGGWMGFVGNGEVRVEGTEFSCGHTNITLAHFSRMLAAIEI